MWINESQLPAWDDPPGSPLQNSGTSGEQASYLIQTFAYGLAAGANALFWYRASDVGERYEWGLLKANGTPRQAYNAYQLAAKYMAGTVSATYSDPTSIVQRIVLDRALGRSLLCGINRRSVSQRLFRPARPALP